MTAERRIIPCFLQPTVILHIVGLISTFAPGSGTTTLPRAIAVSVPVLETYRLMS